MLLTKEEFHVVNKTYQTKGTHVVIRGGVSCCQKRFMLSREGVSCCCQRRCLLLSKGGCSSCWLKKEVYFVVQRIGFKLLTKEGGIFCCPEDRFHVVVATLVDHYYFTSSNNVFVSLFCLKKKASLFFSSSYFHFIFLFTENCGEP